MVIHIAARRCSRETDTKGKVLTSGGTTLIRAAGDQTNGGQPIQTSSVGDWQKNERDEQQL